MNLFVALSLQMFIKLILNIDKLDLFKTKKDRSNVTCLVDCNNQIRLVKDDDNWFFGIMYTVSFKNILIIDTCYLIKIILIAWFFTANNL